MSVIQVETREKSSSAEVNRLRKQGKLPMSLIERSKTTRPVIADAKHVKEVLQTKEGLKIFNLLLDGGKETKVVVKQIDRHDVTRKVITMVLQEIGNEDKIKINVPIEYTGSPRAAAKNLTSLMIQVNQLEVHALVKDLPDSIKIDLSKMRQNDRILLGNVEVPAGVTFLASPETVLASTVQLRGMAAFDDDAAEAAEAASAE